MNHNTQSWIGLGLVLSVAVCLLIFLTLNDYGVTWDEPEYMRAGFAYVEWLKQPATDSVDAYWKLNCEHPPLIKFLGGLSMEVFTHRLRLLDASTSFRFPILIFAFGLALSLFVHGAVRWGAWIGLYVCAGFFLMPRIFFHTHIGAMDFPITALWFMTVLSLNLCITDNRWRYPAAIFLGLALLTKINGLFLYVPAAFALGVHLKRSGEPTNKGVSGTGVFRRGLGWTWPLLAIPPIMFFAGWPWLWEAPVRHIVEYFLFHMRHGYTPVYYFGRQYLAAPWHLPPVLFMATIPLAILVPFFMGLLVSGKRSSGHILMVLSLVLSLGLIAISPSKHDGVRLFLPAFPFACVIAGEGLARIRDFLKTPILRKGFGVVVVILFAVDVIAPTVRYHPYQTAYFNPIVGGVRGALRRGLEFHYWCESYRELVPWLNANPDVLCRAPIAPHLFQTYHHLGLLTGPPRIVDRPEADYLLLPARFGMFDKELFDHYRYREPVFAVRRMGVVLAGIYSLRDPPAGKKSLMERSDP